MFAQEPEGWYKLLSPTNETLRKLYFVDESNGWAVSLGGQIIKTTDAGNNWQIQNSTVITPIVDVFFISSNQGWVLTYPSEPPFGTSIIKTSDGGSSWIKDSVFFMNEIFSTIFFMDENTGFVGGNGIKKTTNGGLSWFNTFIDSGAVSTLPVNNFSFYNSKFGYACGGRIDVAGVIWKTTDSGNNWTSFGLSPDQIFDVFIFDSLNALALSGDPEGFYPISKIKTSDAGLSWSSTALPFLGLSFKIDFLNDKDGWSASGYKFLETTDGGNNWTEQLLFDEILYDLQFVDQYTGFACGENGALFKYVSPERDLPDKPIFELLQNYPNPFSEKTRFSVTAITPDFDLSSRAQIKLFDILGNELFVLVDQDFYEGVYEFIFDPKQTNRFISSGIYILTLFSGDIIVTRKIAYLK